MAVSVRMVTGPASGLRAGLPADAARLGRGGGRYRSRVLQPDDLEAVRASYDRVADTYVDLGIDDLAPQP